MELAEKIVNRKYILSNRIAEDYLTYTWKAQDLSSGKLIALKFLKHRNFRYRKEDLIRFKRRIEIVSGLDNESIEKIYEIDEFNEYTYLAAELFESISLYEYIEKKKPLPYSLSIRIIYELILAMQFIHKNEIIHGDLNPYNIYTQDQKDIIGNTRITGFGYVELNDLHRIKEQQDIFNITGYMSPEVRGIINKKIDERSDLYSLGIISYYMLTGSIPLNADIYADMQKSLSMLPGAPSKINPEIPKKLDEIIFKLLCKEPDERYQSARGLRIDMEKILDGETEFKIASGDKRFKISLNIGLIGRDRELGFLKGLYDRACKSEGNICLISGADGRGKTRIVEELRGYVYDRGGVFLTGKCFELLTDEHRIPYQVITEALNGFIEHFKRLDPKSQREAKERISEFVGKFGEIILKITPSMDGILDEADPLVKLNPAREKERFLNVYSDFICSLGKRNSPVLIFLDNLQWADIGSLSLLYELAGKVHRSPILIICAYRDYEISGDHILYRIKKTYPEIQEIKLLSFNTSELTELAARMLGEKTEHIPGEFIEYMAERSKGNPFFAVQIIKHLNDEKIIYQGNVHWEIDLERLDMVKAPSNMVDILLRRIKLLKEDEKELLACASVIGSKFKLGILYTLSGMSEENVLIIIDKSIELQLLERLPLEKDFLLFTHDRIRDAFYRELNNEKRKDVHLKIAGTIEKIDSTPDRAFSLVHHYSNAGDNEKTLEYAVKSGSMARESYAHEEAILYYKMALEILKKTERQYGPQWIEITKVLSRIYTTIGDYEEAIDILEKIFPLMHTGLEQAGIYRRISTAYFKKGDLKNCERIGRKGLKLLGEKLPFSRGGVILGFFIELIIHVMHSLFPGIFFRTKSHPDIEKYKLISRFYNTINWSYILSDLTKFLRSVLRMLNLAESKIGKSWELGGSLGAYGSTCMSIPLFSRAVRYHNRGLKIREELNDKWGIAQSLQWIGYCYEWTGEYQKSIDFFNKSANIFKEIGDSREYGMCLHGLIQNYYYTSDFNRAKITNDEFYSAATGSNDTFEIVASLALYALCYIHMGNFKDAEFNALKAYNLSYEKEIWMLNCTANAVLGFLFLEKNEFEKAISYLNDAKELFEKKNLLKQYTIYLFPAIALSYIREYEKYYTQDTPGKRKYYLKRIRKSCERALKETKQWASHYGISLICYARYNGFIGKNKRAENLFKQSISHNRKLGMRYWLARSYFEYGLFLKDMGKMEASKSNWQTAYLIFDEIGAKFYLGRTSELLGLINNEEKTREKFIDRKRLSSVITVNQQISSILNIEVLLDNIVSRAIEVTGAMRGYLFIADENTGELKLRASKNLEQRMGDISDFQYSEKMINDVYKTGNIILTHDAGADIELIGYKELHIRELKSIICIPIELHERRIGVFYLDNRFSNSIFSEDDIELLNVFFSQAAISIENAELYSNMEKKVNERTRELRDTQQKLVEAAHQAGMAEIATGVLQNIGNVLYQMDMASDRISNIVKTTKIDDLIKLNDILNQYNGSSSLQGKNKINDTDLNTMSLDIEEGLQRERQLLKSEISDLVRNIEIMKESIEIHQNYVGTKFLSEEINVISIIEDSLRILQNDSFLKKNIVRKNYNQNNVIIIHGQKNKLTHIFVNLLKNASSAISHENPKNRLISIDIKKSPKDIRIMITDNGVGIKKENLKKIFNYGFSTRPGGQGFGLHTCANFMTEMGGTIFAGSGGIGKGAVFTLVFPIIN